MRSTAVSAPPSPTLLAERPSSAVTAALSSRMRPADAEVKELRVNKRRKLARVRVVYVGGGEEEEEEGWVDMSFSGVCGWVSGRLREWEGLDEAAAAGGAGGEGSGGGGGAVGGAGKAPVEQEATRKRKAESEEEGHLLVKQWVAWKSVMNTNNSYTPAIIEDMND